MRLNPHFHSLLLDGVFGPVSAGNGKLAFYAAPTLRQDDVADVLSAARRRILRYLERRGILAPVAMPGDGEMGVAGEDALAETDPLLARLLRTSAYRTCPTGACASR